MILDLETGKSMMRCDVSKYVHKNATHILIGVDAILEEPNPKHTIIFHAEVRFKETRLYLGDFYPGLKERRFILKISPRKKFLYTIPDLKYKVLAFYLLGYFVDKGTFFMV